MQASKSDFETSPTRQSRRKAAYGLWALRGLAALVFLAAGGAKFAGVQQLVEVFDKIGAGQWLRYLTGGLEIGGALLIIAPCTAFWGGALLACVMAGAVAAHLALIGGSPMPALILLILTGSVAWAHRCRMALQ